MAEQAGDITKKITAYNNGVEGALVDIRSDDANLAYNTTTQTLEIVSSDANDDGTATGTLTLVSAIATDVAIVNGLTFTGVAGVKTDNTEFSIDTSDTAAAADLVLSINARGAGTTVPTATVVASSAAGVVTINSDGEIGNLVDISSPDATITASAATLADVDTAGAWSVTVEGLDANYLEQEETVFLNGTVAKLLANQFIFVSKMYVATAGTGGVNEGTITLRISGAGATQLTMAINDNESQSSNYIIPANKTGEITNVTVTLGNDPSVVNSNQVEISTKEIAVTDSVFRLKDTFGVPFAASRNYENGEFELASKTAIQFKSIRPLGAVANKVNLQYTIILHRL